MARQEHSQKPSVAPVSRSKYEARQFYDRVSGLYDYIARIFERTHSELALKRVAIQSGETVLEIGFGTGHDLCQIARLVGHEGKACGIDISESMLKVTRERLGKARLMDGVELFCGDAAMLPFKDSFFDAAFMSFTLELFETSEIPEVLGEIKRVLKPGGRLGVVSMSRSYGESPVLRLYEWAHRKWPKYIDCRPIYVEESLRDARYSIQSKKKTNVFGLPLEIINAVKET